MKINFYKKIPISREKLAKVKKIGFISGLALLGLVVVIFLSLTALSFVYQDKIYPHTYLGGVNFGGKTRPQAKLLLANLIEKSKIQQQTFVFSQKNYTLKNTEINLTYEDAKTLDSIFQVGRRPHFFASMWEIAKSIFSKNKARAVYTFKGDIVNQFIGIVQKDVDKPVLDAYFYLQNDEIQLHPEQDGHLLQLDALKKMLSDNFAGLDFGSKNLPVKIIKPKITSQMALAAKAKIEEMIATPLKLVTKENNFLISRKGLLEWVQLASIAPKTSVKGTAAFDLEITPQLKTSQIQEYVKELAGKLNRDPVDGKIAFQNGHLVLVSDGQIGYKLDEGKTVQLIVTALTGGGSRTITLPLTEIQPTVAKNNIANLGIKELIGKGTTSFARSPQNRRHNIAIGASLLSGQLIKPGEVFSTLAALGKIDTSQGFLPELVIKEDVTVPEVGGGLCQVSTTLFRAILNTGLPVVERKNHRYRVSYYEPPVGMDATIYIPSPDLKFKNDTPGYILIQGYVSGNYLTFEFYGTSDGRRVETTTPAIYAVVGAGEPIYTVSPDLAQGEIKQVEKAHPGSKASFTYTVYNKDGSVRNKQTFYSVYVAWKARYLIGPDTPIPGTEAPAGETTTSTNPPETTTITPETTTTIVAPSP